MDPAVGQPVYVNGFKCTAPWESDSVARCVAKNRPIALSESGCPINLHNSIPIYIPYDYRW